jgi:hypothetical protein
VKKSCAALRVPGTERTFVEYHIKVTVLDKKLFPDLQYCAVPENY